MKLDAMNKALLSLLVAGIWMLAFPRLIPITPVAAQGGRQYEWLIESNGKMQVGGSGNMTLNDQEVRTGIALASRAGWKVHTHNVIAVVGGVGVMQTRALHYVLLER